MAGSWGSNFAIRRNHVDGKLQKPYGIVCNFIADSSDGSIPDKTIYHSGFICGVDVEFGTTAPNSIIVDLKSIGGFSLPGFPAAAKTASGRIDVTPPVPIAGGMTLHITNNTTHSATGNIVPLVI
jgi:hypothetical protein